MDIFLRGTGNTVTWLDSQAADVTDTICILRKILLANVPDNSFLEWQNSTWIRELGQFVMAQLVTLSAGFSAGRIITYETMKIQALQFMACIYCFIGVSRHGLLFAGMDFFFFSSNAVIAVIVYVVVTDISMLFLTDCKPSQ